jgi:hypothetical protein
MSAIRCTILDGTEKNWHVFSTPTAAQAYIDSKKQQPTEQIAKIGEYVIHKGAPKLYPNKAVKVTEITDNNSRYQYVYADGNESSMAISQCRIATQQEIDRDWKKLVLLTTQDGVECYNNEQTLYGVNEQFGVAGRVSVRGVITEPCATIKWFSTEAARTEWIIQNKPLFSIADLKKMDKEQYPRSILVHTIALSVEKLHEEAKKRIEG